MLKAMVISDAPNLRPIRIKYGNEGYVTTKRTWLKDPFCGISHIVGALLSVAGLITLLILAKGRLSHVIVFTVYGASLVLLYTASALYHSLRVSDVNHKRLQRFDHVAIFLLIAGTYTPVCLFALGGNRGWSLLAAVYSIALVGIAITVFWKQSPAWVKVVLYILMGWMCVIALPTLHRTLPPAAMGWLVSGGIVYSVGCVIFATDWPHLWPGKFSAHDLWHVFVLAGSACHFILVLCFLV